MNYRNELDLDFVELREEIISLTKEFEEKHGKSTNHYSALNNYITKKLRTKSDKLMKKHVLFSGINLSSSSRNI